MEVIKFDLEKLEKEKTGFSYYILGRSYDLEENDVKEDYEKSLDYYQKGFDINYPLCTYSLGVSYQLGLGNVLEIDEEKAKKLLTRAYPGIIRIINDENLFDVEKLYAKFVIGAYHYFGLGDIETNHDEAFRIIKGCAEEGYIAAIYDLGNNFYFNGIGTKVNIEEADKWLKIAVENGLLRAIKVYEERKVK